MRLLIAVAVASGLLLPQGAGLTARWQLSGAGRGGPGADQSTVFFLGAHHEVVAADRQTGRLRWKARTREAAGNTQGPGVTLVGESVVIGDYDLFGFDRQTGARLWSFSPRDGYGPGIYLGRQGFDGLVFAGSPSGKLYAVDARSGIALWTVTLSSNQTATVFAPTVHGDVVLCGFTIFATPMVGGILAVDARTGAMLWRTDFPIDRRSDSAWAGGPVVVGDSVFATNRNGSVYGFDLRDGSINTVFGPDRCVVGMKNDFRALTHVGTTLIAGSSSGCLTAFAVDKRQELWNFKLETDGSVGFALASDDQSVYVPYVSGRIIILDAHSGRERGILGQMEDPFTGPPAVVDNCLYVQSSKTFAAYCR